jgi:hypothetical protein
MTVTHVMKAAMKPVAAILLLAWLAGCSTTQALDVPKPTPREQPINSLALEQCLRENGAGKCSADGQ